MKKIVFLTILLVWTLLFAQPPERTGIGVGYMTTPNSLVYRMSWSEKTFFDIWLDIPEFYAGDNEGYEIGAGAGYAIYLMRQQHFCYMIRPQISLRYINSSINYAELGLGIAGAVVAHLDSIGAPNTDVFAGISTGTVGQFGKNYTVFKMPLILDKPFGILVGVIKYF